MREKFKVYAGKFEIYARKIWHLRGRFESSSRTLVGPESLRGIFEIHVLKS